MRLTEAQRQENHDRIVRAAARLYREKGVDGVGIDEIMAEAGLTHGAFYGHFPSKQALVAEASAYALDQTGLRRLVDGRRGGARRTFPDLARRYLSTRHRDEPGLGCPVAALAADVGRQDEAVKARFAEHLDLLLNGLAERLPGDSTEARRQAILKFAAMVGALTMARSAGKSALSDELLETVRQELTAGEPAPKGAEAA